MNLNCLVVEDDPIDSALLESFIGEANFLTIVAICDNIKDAKRHLLNNDINLIFCDVMLPDGKGLDFIKELSNPPQVVFTTTFPDYAVNAFDLNATDYIVKPLTYERFIMAAKRALEKQYPLHETPHNVAEPKVIDDHFFIRSDSNFIRVNFADIIYVQGMKDYSKVVTKLHSYMTAMSIGVLAPALPENDFLQVHRSYIVNANRIESVNNYEIIIEGQTIPIGLSYREAFFQKVVERKIVRR